MNDKIEQSSRLLVELFRGEGLMIATAESCTGGLIAANITSVAGASRVFERGFVTYTNEAKHELLEVPESVIASHGAVSSQTAQAMAKGALARSKANVALSVTGIAGPDGGSEEKPVGLVYFGLAGLDGHLSTSRFVFPGNRQEVRAQAVLEAFELLLGWLRS